MSKFTDQGFISRITDPNFIMAVQMGLIPGFEVISKFAENPDISSGAPGADLWDYPTEPIYTFSENAVIDSISSDNDNDDQMLVIQGLDEDFLQVTQTKFLTGFTPAILDTPLIRVKRMFNGNGTETLGNAYLYENGGATNGIPDDTSTVRAYNAIAEQGTLLGVYTIPANKTGFFLGLSTSISRSTQSTGLRFTGRARTPGGVFITQIRFNLSSVGTSHVNIPATAHSRFPSKTDFLAHAEVTANGTGGSVTFDLLLVDNNLIE